MTLPLETWGSTPAEQRRDMPGDDLIAEPSMSATRAVDLDCDPDVAFGWLTQMGFGRAGWYSYDWIDNLGRPSARSINPEWQVTAVGDTVPGGPIDFTVHHLDPPTAFVIGVLGRRALGHRIDFTLGFVVEDRGSGSRLVSRARAAIEGPLCGPTAAALTIGDGIMVRRQLLNLAQRCRR